MASAHYAVVDVETTGLSSKDRLVEAAVVVLDRSGEVVDEYDTLINPQRDVGATDIHGITASMVEAAPTFEEVAAAIARRVEGAILVAHNLPFDRRMLKTEYERLGAELDAGTGVCTLRLTGLKLSLACKRHGVELTAHHRALMDARATADLLRAHLAKAGGTAAAFRSFPEPYEPRTLRREATGVLPTTLLRRLISRTPYPSSDGAVLCYLDALDRALDDQVVESAEWEHLHALAVELNLGSADVDTAQRRYLHALIGAVLRDGRVTTTEHALVATIAKALHIDDISIPPVTDAPQFRAPAAPGMRVCFTGSAIDGVGNAISRETLEAHAAFAGLQPVSTVTKKSCDLLVAADVSSASGKAKKAREYGIPVISVAEFLKGMQHPDGGV